MFKGKGGNPKVVNYLIDSSFFTSSLDRDGKSRQFAFIGYHAEQEVAEAIKYFNKSYLDTSRIICEPRVRSKMWANDIVLDTTVNQNGKVIQEKAVAEKKSRQISAPRDVDIDETNKAVDDDDDETKVPDNLARDEIQEGSSNDLDSEIVDPGNRSSGLKDDGDEVLESDRLFVRNLPYTATHIFLHTPEDELTEFFSKFGDVSQVHLVIDKETKRSKGIAYVLYKVPECAVRALEEVDNSIFQGRLLHVMPVKLKKPTGKQDDSANKGSKTFKQKREEKRKASEASGHTRAWNSLFMRPDTVVENIARKYGVSKSDLLDREADDLAVCIALGETQVA
ncbi:hypothetical protein DITRI_Ditri18aG0036200 [Diplodiscus trichospermus]